MRLRYALSGALLALTMALILEGLLSLSLVLGWLIGINVFTFVFYAIDKLNSQSSTPYSVRIPEFALLFMALAGGSPAAGLAMLLLSHKVRKLGFLISYGLVLAAQGVAVYLFRDALPLP
jgi:uncharacterized membrane protein YsdA (DUF1294 family)